MKRTLAWILTLVMLLGMLPMSVFAEETATDTTFKLYFETDVTDVSALEIGDKITVTAYLENNPGFAGMKTKLTWDNSVVQFEGFTTETFRNQEYLVSEVIGDATYSQTAGTVVVGEVENLTANGKMWEAVFTVLKDGDTRIALSTDGDDFQMVNAATTKLSPTIDQTALDALIVPPHIHDYAETEVIAPTCTEGGYTKHTCACGDSYTDNATSATGHTYVDGTCSVCGAAGTIIPEGAPFIDMITTDGQPVTVTLVGTEPVYGMGPLYKVEVPLGTTQVNVTYPEDAVLVTQFGYSQNMMIGFANVSDDGYGVTKKDGKVTVGLAMEKAPANGAPNTIKLINVPYGDEPRSVGFPNADQSEYHFLAFTYKLGNGQHFAALPEGIGYTVTGSPIASDGYTFQVSLEDGYEATADFAVKVNGETVATQPGQVSVLSVTEDLNITVEGVAKIVEATDISITLDLTDYTGTFDGYLGYTDRNYNSNEVNLQVGKSNTLTLNAADNGGFYAQAYTISPLVTGWMINDTAYYYPNEYKTYSLADGVQMSMNTDGYFSVDITSTNPYIAVIKPIVGTPESVGAAPDFAEDCIDVTDISVLGADVVSSAWDGDTLNVILAEDTAADATIKTLWTIPVKNSNEGAGNAMFNINGRLQTPGPNMTYTWADNLTLAEGVANKTYAFEAANTPWDPNSALTFTSKTFTVNFYVSGKEPAPTYTVSIDEEITGGTVTADPTSAEEGAEVTLTVTPDDGYILKTLTVTDASDEEVTVTDNKFTMPATNVTVSAVFEEEVSEPESSFPFTITVNGNTVTAVEDGTEYSNVAYTDVPKYVATVPAGTTSFTISNESGFIMMAIADPYTYLSEGGNTCTVNISGNTGYIVGTTDGTFIAHLYVEFEGTTEPENPSEPDNTYGIELVVGGEKVELVSAGTEKCGMLTATIFNVTVPAGTEEITVNNIADKVVYGQMYVYKGDHSWDEFASNVTTATLNLAQCGTSFCISDSANAWYHVNITVEEPAPSYKSSYGITVMVGDEEMDLVANGTETCGMLTATKLNLTVPADTTEVTFLNIAKTGSASLYVYNGAHNWEEFGRDAKSVTVNLAERGTSFCVSDSANAWYHVNITVEEPEIEPNPITEIEVSHPSIVTDETTGALSMAMVTGASEQINVKTVLENAELDATQVVVWSSSDPEVAAVENGKVTALKAGSTVITAKAVDASPIALLADGEDVLAQFTLTVADPTDGYTVTMGEDVEAVVNNTVSVPVTIGHTGDVTKYNAFDLTFEYDPTVLELTSTKIDGMTVTVKDGKIHVERYGTDLTVGSTALTLTFKAIATGNTNVKVTSAKVDISESALTQDAPDASVIDNITLVAVTGFTVSLPAEFTGESSVLPGENYTFEAKDKNYNYTFDGSTMDGQPVTVKDNGDGTFTIENVTGNIAIQTVPTGKTFDITLGEDMTDNVDQAQYMTDYTATLTKKDGFTYNIKVTIGGKDYTGFTYDASTGLITIPGEAITGEIVFNSNKTAKTPDKHSVEFTGEYGDIAEGTLMEVDNGTNYTLTINKVLGYKYTVTATMAGEPAEVIDNGDGTYTIENVTGDLVITIAKEYDLAVEVTEYVKLNGKVMFLVTATATVDEGKVLSYNGTAMFYSNQYNAWSFLVITEGTLSVDDAKNLITLNEGTKVELDQTYNVNESVSGTVDINDAQLVFDMYNNKYQDFDNATMQKFLKADVNGDKTINTGDAAAVVSEIVKNK